MKNFFSLLSSTRDVTPSFFVLPPKSYRLYRYTHWALCAPHTNVLHCPLVIHYRSATTESVRLFFCFPFHRHRTKDVPEYQNNLNLGMLFFPEEIIQVLIEEKKDKGKNVLFCFFYSCSSSPVHQRSNQMVNTRTRAHTHIPRESCTPTYSRGRLTSFCFSLTIENQQFSRVWVSVGWAAAASWSTHRSFVGQHTLSVCVYENVSQYVCVCSLEAKQGIQQGGDTGGGSPYLPVTPGTDLSTWHLNSIRCGPGVRSTPLFKRDTFKEAKACSPHLFPRSYSNWTWPRCMPRDWEPDVGHILTTSRIWSSENQTFTIRISSNRDVAFGQNSKCG